MLLNKNALTVIEMIRHNIKTIQTATGKRVKSVAIYKHHHDILTDAISTELKRSKDNQPAFFGGLARDASSIDGVTLRPVAG